jgi:N,N'-diacetyllegionaminate synthase
MIKPVKIGSRLIGPGQPCFIIAEAGVNHNGDMKLAHKLIHEAAQAGADAVKFQTFTPESVIVHDAPKAAYQLQTTPDDESQLEMIRKLALSHDQFRELKAASDELGIVFLSTPIAPEDADFLVGVGAPALKVASMDIVNYPLLKYFGKLGVPVIASTGMATLGEVENGLDTLRKAGCEQVVLLHCVSNYPIRDDQVNLRVMDTLVQAFQVPVGFSDHTTSIAIPIAAVARGACVIEKHLTLDKGMSGPDHASSLAPEAFRYMAAGIRAVESALGEPVKYPLQVEIDNRKTMRRSLVAAEDLPAGTVLQTIHFALKRPGVGLGAEFIPLFIGRLTLQPVQKDQMITLDILLPPAA